MDEAPLVASNARYAWGVGGTAAAKAMSSSAAAAAAAATRTTTTGDERRTSTRRRVPPTRVEAEAPTQREEKLLRLAILKSQAEVSRKVDVREATSEAPVLRPTWAEFEDPIRYLKSVAREIAPFGIAKIVPPEGWACPCALERDAVTIETKLQTINRLGEGVPYGDGRTFEGVDAYRSMAERFRAEWEARLAADGLDPASEEAWEQTYWRLVEGSEEVKVEYGNDVSTEAFGSAFPGFPPPESVTRYRASTNDPLFSPASPPPPHRDDHSPSPSHARRPAYYDYATSPWNLNNLPRARGSVLRHLRDRINGINVPWLYFGMSFSTFSWHVEDNWLWSINYSHGGHTKTWYGVPPADKEAFDDALKLMIPVRFADEPELLSQITTMMSPAYLASHGVRVCRLDHHPGEFVVTMPAAYHAGFSHGFNVGEAVNFALPSWIRPGRLCRNVYREQHRRPVIAHDKIVWQLAQRGPDFCDGLDEDDLELLVQELRVLLDEETRLRDRLVSEGVTFRVRMPPEPIDSDEPDIRRRCCECLQPCSLSAVICKCSPNKTACPRHHLSLCACPAAKKCMVFWSSVEELRAKCDGVATVLAERRERRPWCA